ncbi:MAG: JDVT-CTERM domain-containing protein [Burkholderiales bacterium]
MFGCLSPLVHAVPLAHLDAETLDFKVQTIKTISSPLAITLSNTGDSNLNITAIRISGEFSLGATYACSNTASNCTPPALPCTTLQPGEGCTFNVWYTPVNDPGINQVQKYSSIGSLQFTTNAADANASVALIGATDSTTCTVSSNVPTTKFASTQFGAASATTEIFPITSGASELPLAISVNGDFRQENNCKSPLPANSSCNVTVTFNPVIEGTRNGNIYFNSQPHVCGFADAILQGVGTGTNPVKPAVTRAPVNPTAPTQADPNAGKGNDRVGGGDTTTDIKGCSMGKSSVFDPVLIMLMLVAMLNLYRRRSNE